MPEKNPKKEAQKLLDNIPQNIEDIDDESTFEMALHKDEIVRDVQSVLLKCEKMKKSRMCRYCLLWIGGKCLYNDKYKDILFNKKYDNFEDDISAKR